MTVYGAVLEPDERIRVESKPLGNSFYAWQVTARSPTEVATEVEKIMSGDGVLRSEFRPIERVRDALRPVWTARGYTELVPLIGGANVVRQQERAA